MRKFYLTNSIEDRAKCYIYAVKQIDNPIRIAGFIKEDMTIGMIDRNICYIKYFKTKREAIGTLTKILGRKLNRGEFVDSTQGRFD